MTQAGRLARRCERLTWRILKCFPLAFVYGLSTWAISVETKVGIWHTQNYWKSTIGTTLAILFYLSMNISYSVAVFTDPGSPLKPPNRNRHEYSHLPTTELPEYSALTVSSTGGSRYCKKCQCPKPDRTHHCSTCKRCVLKMDHHCPWLATCVGFYNYKAFLLFLIYTCLFCYVCFIVSATWVWNEMLTDTQEMEKLFPINVIILALISGIMGLVLSGFTSWHISLAVRGLTTIECLEKTRYLSPLRKTLDRQRWEHQHNSDHSRPDGQTGDGISRTLQNYGQQFIDMHANAIPGVTREEEGEERPSPTVGSHDPTAPSPMLGGYNPDEHMDDYQSPAQLALYRSYGEMERVRERDRYEEYLDEQDSEKLPNAFDLGWRRNLTHLFGPNPILWPLPICTTTGDGWHWEPSAEWLESREGVARRRLERQEEARRQQTEYAASQHRQRRHPDPSGNRWGPRGRGGQRAGENPNELERPSTGLSMKTLRPVSPRPHRDIDSDYDSDTDDSDYASHRPH